MFNTSVHNVTEFKTARVHSQGYDDGGWIVLNVTAENHSWVDEGQDQIASEVTFFMKDMELGWRIPLLFLLDKICKTPGPKALSPLLTRVYDGSKRKSGKVLHLSVFCVY